MSAAIVRTHAAARTAVAGRAIVTCACAFALGLATLGAQALPPEPSNRPELDPARVAGEVLVGTYAGLGGFLVGRYLGGSVANLLPRAAESTRENFAHWTGLAAGGAATAGGVYAIGSMGDQRGSYAWALAGAGAGYVTVIAVTRLIASKHNPAVTPEQSRARWLRATVESLLPAIGATIAFNSTRRFK